MLLYSFPSYWPHFSADFCAFHPIWGWVGITVGSEGWVLPGSYCLTKWEFIHSELAASSGLTLPAWNGSFRVTVCPL